jgi:hypothetical protein
MSRIARITESARKWAQQKNPGNARMSHSGAAIAKLNLPILSKSNIVYVGILQSGCQFPTPKIRLSGTGRYRKAAVDVAEVLIKSSLPVASATEVTTRQNPAP